MQVTSEKYYYYIKEVRKRGFDIFYITEYVSKKYEYAEICLDCISKENKRNQPFYMEIYVKSSKVHGEYKQKCYCVKPQNTKTSERIKEHKISIDRYK